jgi:hypothetical protein
MEYNMKKRIIVILSAIFASVACAACIIYRAREKGGWA